MNKFKNLFFFTLTIAALSLSSCLHIIEEATFFNNGQGEYKMLIDMSEMKGMMDMMKNMAPDSAGAEAANPMAGGMEQENSMAMLGQEMSKVSESIKSIQGISDVIEISDTSSFKYGYTFKFKDVATLNRALKVINKEKYESKVDEIYKFSGKSFERLGAGDLGAELKKAMSESGGEDDEAGSMEMVKMFFADMSYKQIYHFPDRKVKKSNNSISEISDDGHTLTIDLKPFNEEQQKKNVGVSTKVKLK